MLETFKIQTAYVVSQYYASHSYRVVFLTGPPLKMSLDWPPQKMPRLAPPCFGKVLSMAAETVEIPNTLTFSIPMGGQSGTLMFF